MTPASDDRLDELVAAVQSAAKYRSIQPELVRRIGTQELGKGRSLKEAVKETRNKLHQIGGAYQETAPDYARFTSELQALPSDPADPRVVQFCQQAMHFHASTRERLPVIPEFYAKITERIGPLHSVLDLACGLNPLALSWMGLTPQGEYTACDIYADLAGFLNAFFAHTGIRGQAGVCDLTASVPSKPVQLALLLKTLPCLEQLDKTIGPRLLDGINAEHVLVSFPARSLGGRSKGMVQNYTRHFEELLAGKPWRKETWEVGTELVFWLAH